MTPVDEMTPLDDELRRAAAAIRTARGEATFTVRLPGASHSASGVAVALVVGLAMVVVLGIPMLFFGSGPRSGSPTPEADGGVAANLSEPSGPSDVDYGVGTVVTDTAPGNCPDQPNDQVTTDTMYLGGPASDQNLGAKGFLYSLSAGPTPVEVATRMVALAFTGHECAVSGQTDADGTGVTVTISPPWVPEALLLDVSIAEHDGVIGVTGIGDRSDLEIRSTNDVTTVQFVEGAPPNTAAVDVRFKKGDDVWYLTPDPASAEPIALKVPAIETDRFPESDVDWVLVVFFDVDRKILGVTGALTS
jgi:hypothetical protein